MLTRPTLDDAHAPQHQRNTTSRTASMQLNHNGTNRNDTRIREMRCEYTRRYMMLWGWMGNNKAAALAWTPASDFVRPRPDDRLRRKCAARSRSAGGKRVKRNVYDGLGSGLVCFSVDLLSRLCVLNAHTNLYKQSPHATSAIYTLILMWWWVRLRLVVVVSCRVMFVSSVSLSILFVNLLIFLIKKYCIYNLSIITNQLREICTCNLI